MAESSDQAHTELSRSQKAGSALEKIRDSTLKALQQVKEIVQATEEQARGSQQITKSIDQGTSILGQIASAVQQQTAGSRKVKFSSEKFQALTK